MRTFSPRRRAPRRRGSPPAPAAFTLIELLVTLVISALVLITLLTFTDSVEQAWKRASADPYAEAGEAFETIVSHVAASTLEPYQDYADATGNFLTNGAPAFTPDHLARRSDLAFVCGLSSGANGWLTASGRITAAHCLFFIAPQGYTQTYAHLGLERLLQAQGYFVEFSADSAAPAFILPAAPRPRWRLKEIVQPSESLGIYSTATSLPWVQSLVPAGGPTDILAENVIALVLLPERVANDAGAALAPNYQYDSRAAAGSVTRNQLPPRLRVALVAIDEASARNLAAVNGTQPPALVPPGFFADASKMDADLAALDSSLTAAHLGHRIFQREILLPGAAWSETGSP